MDWKIDTYNLGEGELIYVFAVQFVRTKFDLDMIPVEMDPHLRIRQMSLDLSSPNHIPLNVRIAEFCEDPQNMDEMSAFIDDILKKAQIEATARLERKNKVDATRNNVEQIKMKMIPSDLALLPRNDDISIFFMNDHCDNGKNVIKLFYLENDTRLPKNSDDYIFSIFSHLLQTESKKNGKGNEYSIILLFIR